MNASCVNKVSFLLIPGATATDTLPANCRTKRPTFFMYGERMTSGTKEIRIVIRGQLSQPSQIDLQPPVTSNMASQTVDYKSDLSPSTLGKPSVSDNKGSNTILTHQDLPASSCSFQRKWIATDQAVNSASKIQDINLINLRPRQ